MDHDRTPLSRLAAEICREVRIAGSYNALGNLVGIDRRKLDRISKGLDVALTFRELTSLNDYLVNRGSGVSRVFSPPSVVRMMAEHGALTFVAGSQPDSEHQRIDFSRWDVRAMREVLQAINATGRPVYFTIEDVIFRESAESAEHFGVPERVAKIEAWYHCLEGNGPSIVCLGSPKACHAAEVMLARMMGVAPFKSWPEAPFYFVWPDHDPRAAEMHSAFKRSAAEFSTVEGVPPRVIQALGARASRDAVFFDGTAHHIKRDTAEWTSYALIAAQRRPENQLWLVIAGATGPATLGAARVAASFVADLPSSPNESSPVVWARVEVQVTDRKPASFRRDERRIAGQPVLGPLRQWKP